MKYEFSVVNDKTGNNISIKQKTRNKQFDDKNFLYPLHVFLNRTENW